MKTNLRTATIAVVACVAFVAVTVLAWHGIWHLRRANTGQQYRVNTGTQQYQAGLISQERDRAQAYDLATDPGQRTQIALTFCQVYPELTRPTADLSSAAANLCSQDPR